MTVSPKLHLYFHTPVPIFKARVNMPVPTYPANSLDFDGVTLGVYGDVLPGMTLILGTTDGADDLGRVRVKSSESDNIRISRSSKGTEDGTVAIQDNAYITVLDDYRVWAKLPYFDLDNGVDFKDGNLAPGDNNTNIPPVSNCGPGFAGFTDTVMTVQFPRGGVNSSYAMADATTISTFLWDVGDGTITVGTSASAVITATFPPGFRWVSLTVTDSNGKTHISRCPVLAVDPDDDVTYRGISGNQRLQINGQTLEIDLPANLPRVDYPDGTLVMFWWDEAASPGDRDHMKFIGWIDKENYSVGRNKTGLLKKATITCLDVSGRLNILPGFPQALERDVGEDIGQWSYMPDLDMNKSLHYLLHWHSTALELADFILPANGDDYNAMRIDASGATLFQQVDSQAQKMVPDHLLTCNSQGQLQVRRNWMYDDVGERPTADPIITEGFWNDLSFEYNRHPRVHVLRSGAVLASEAYDENEEIPLAFCVAPGVAEAFGQGTTEQIENEGLALTQIELNRCEGHRYALLNSRYGEFKLSDPSGVSFWDYEPALMNRVQLQVSATMAMQRSLDFTAKNGLVKSVEVSYSSSNRGTLVTASLTMQMEDSGYPAKTYIPEDVEPVEYVPPAPGFDYPDYGLVDGASQVAGVDSFGIINRTSDFQSTTPTWDSVYLDHAEAVEPQLLQCFVVDPFSPGYITTPGGAINGWAVNLHGIWRLTDLFGTTPGAELQHSFAVTDAMYDGTYAIAASFGTYFETDNPWIVVTAHVNRAGGTVDFDDGVWAIHSEDAGATWSSAVRISPIANSGTTYATVQRPTVWTSPRTAGYAISFAYTTTTVVEGYYTDDWGDTWYKLTDEDTADPELPMLIDFDGFANATDVTKIGSSITIHAEAVSGPGAGVISAEQFILFAPPENAVRLRVRFSVQAYRTQVPLGTTATTLSVTIQNTTGTSFTETMTFTAPAANDPPFYHDFEVEWDRIAGTEWPGNREDTVTPPSGTQDDGFARIRLQCAANGGSSGNAAVYMSLSAQVLEIEFEDASVWTPGAGSGLNADQGMGGGIHIPWEDNVDEGIIYYGRLVPGATNLFTLHRIVAGVETNITPVNGSDGYGPYRGLFGIRTHDNNRQKLLFCGKTENADGFHYYAIFSSSDAGSTWTLIQGPDREDEFGNYQGWEAAFAADDVDTLFIWGGSQRDQADGATSYGTVIGYSTDFGATIADKTGNLITLEASDENLSGFIGIAGGPTAL